MLCSWEGNHRSVVAVAMPTHFVVYLPKGLLKTHRVLRATKLCTDGEHTALSSLEIHHQVEHCRQLVSTMLFHSLSNFHLLHLHQRRQLADSLPLQTHTNHLLDVN